MHWLKTYVAAELPRQFEFVFGELVEARAI